MAILCEPYRYPKYTSDNVRNLFSSSYCLMDFVFGVEAVQWGITKFEETHLYGIDVFCDEGFGPHSADRNRRHIVRDSVRDFIIVVPLVGSYTIWQQGTTDHVMPGCFRILSSTIPFSGRGSATDNHQSFSKITARVSGSILRRLVPNIDGLCLQSASIRPGAGALMKSLFSVALQEGPALTPSQADDFGNSLIHAVANAVLNAPEFDSERGTADPLSQENILCRARKFIEANLASPMLSCGLVAAHCGVSERHLRTVFKSTSNKVGDLIREARLQNVRSALLNPILKNQTIFSIAQGWGFTDPASFCRIYKERFGLPPGEERRGLGGSPDSEGTTKP